MACDDELINRKIMDFYRVTSKCSYEDLENAIVYLIKHRIRNAGVILAQLFNDELALREINLQNEKDIVLATLARNYVFDECEKEELK